MNEVIKVKKEKQYFNIFWISQSISMVGSQITVIGLPLTAIYYLNANSTQMGVFQVLATLPFFLFSLFAGVWIDKSRKKNILVICNILLAISLLVIPLGANFNFLNLTIFYLVVFCAGTFSMVFELAYLSYLPLLVSKANLTKGNSKLEISRTIIDVSGPAVAGNIIAIFTAPIAIIIDIFCYILSTILLINIKITEPIKKVGKPTNILKQIQEGLKLLFGNPILRNISISTAVLNFFRTAFDTIFLLFLVKTLFISAGKIGLILSLGSIGGIIGAFLATKISIKIGIGHSIIGSTLIVWLGGIIISIFGGNSLFSISLIIIGQILVNFGNTVYFITQVSLRQSITPINILGRINASNRFLTRGAMPAPSIILCKWLNPNLIDRHI